MKVSITPTFWPGSYKTAEGLCLFSEHHWDYYKIEHDDANERYNIIGLCIHCKVLARGVFNYGNSYLGIGSERILWSRAGVKECLEYDPTNPEFLKTSND